MSLILIAGDTHNRTINKLSALANELDCPIIQTGDLGLFFHPDHGTLAHEMAHLGPQVYSCLGNHDNYPHLSTFEEKDGWRTYGRCSWASRPALLKLHDKTFCFFGGAESTDSFVRKEGTNWWSQETPTNEEFEALTKLLQTTHIDYIITHDAPAAIQPHKHGETVTGISTRYTAMRFQALYEMLENPPKLWFYGHHHEMSIKSLPDKKVKFICTGLHQDSYLLNTKTDELTPIPATCYLRLTPAEIAEQIRG